MAEVIETAKAMKHTFAEFQDKLDSVGTEIANNKREMLAFKESMFTEIETKILEENQKSVKRAEEHLEVLKKKADDANATVFSQMSELNNTFLGMTGRVNGCIEAADYLKDKFERDSEAFIRDKARWKSDFDMATLKAGENVVTVKNIVKNCIKQEKLNSQAMKMILDAMMIQ